MLGTAFLFLTWLAVARRSGRWTGLPLFSFDMHVRYFIPYLPFCILALADAWDWLRKRLSAARVRLAGWVFLGCLVVGFGGALANDIKTIAYNYESFPGLKDAGLWLRPRVNSETRIASYKPYPSFWAGCRFIKTPDEADAATIVDAVRRQSAQYLVVNVHMVKYHVAGLDPLLVSPLPDHLDRRLTLLKMETDRPDPYQNTAIYRINSTVPIRR